MAPSWSCRRSPLSCRFVHARAATRLVAGSSAVSQHRPDRVTALYRDTPSGQAFLLSRYKRLYRDTLTSQTARLSRYKDCIVTQPPVASPSLMSRYKTMYRDTIHQSGLARVRCQPSRGLPWPCRGLYRGRAGRIVADHAHPCAPTAHLGLSPRPCLSSPVSQYNLLYCDSHFKKKNGQ